jgi:hypothetical protein
VERERKTEQTPQVGDHVTLMGTNVTGDVRRVDRSQGHDRVSFKVTAVLGASKKSKAARAFRGAWITCRPELLVPDGVPAHGGNTTPPALDGALRAHVERLVAEFAHRYSREQIERRVVRCASRYADAHITAFVPLLVYRDVRSALSDNGKKPK